jgi:hypothetical protein
MNFEAFESILLAGKEEQNSPEYVQKNPNKGIG